MNGSKNLEYRFLVKSTAFENATFPHKTAQSEASVKTLLLSIYLPLKKKKFYIALHKKAN